MDEHLSKYIDELNIRARLFNLPEIDKSTFNKRDPMFWSVQRATMEQLECDLSPENLTQDGELRGEALVERTMYLVRVKTALQKITNEILPLSELGDQWPFPPKT